MQPTNKCHNPTKQQHVTSYNVTRIVILQCNELPESAPSTSFVAVIHQHTLGRLYCLVYWPFATTDREQSMYHFCQHQRCKINQRVLFHTVMTDSIVNITAMYSLEGYTFIPLHPSNGVSMNFPINEK